MFRFVQEQRVSKSAPGWKENSCFWMKNSSRQMFQEGSVLRNEVKVHQVSDGRSAVRAVPGLLDLPHVDHQLLHFTGIQCSPDHYLWQKRLLHNDCRTATTVGYKRKTAQQTKTATAKSYSEQPRWKHDTTHEHPIQRRIIVKSKLETEVHIEQHMHFADWTNPVMMTRSCYSVRTENITVPPESPECFIRNKITEESGNQESG